jgi:DNA-binding beta-propeller fold protein YncE
MITRSSSLLFERIASASSTGTNASDEQEVAETTRDRSLRLAMRLRAAAAPLLRTGASLPDTHVAAGQRPSSWSSRDQPGRTVLAKRDTVRRLMRRPRYPRLRTVPVLALVAASTAAGATPALAANSIYWGTEGENTISFANLDGSGGGDLNTGAANVSEPFGVALDPETGTIYWANDGNNTIAYARLDGSGGANLTTTGATVELPVGVTIDPVAGRIYWANFHNPGGSISYANLNGTGGGNLTTTGAMVEGPEGVAIEPVAGRIYWGNYHGNTISYANLNGTGGGNLSTSGANVESPAGLAIDPVAERIYWANSTNPGGGISFAALNGSGGGNLATTGANVIDPAFPSLLEAPSATGAPAIGGGFLTGSTLTCSNGSWAPDIFSEFFYRAPQTYSYSWQLGGTEIAGASAQTFTPTQPGLYSCRVTAANHAGSGAQTSAQVQISPAPATPPPASPVGAPVVSHAAQTNKRWREGDRQPQISRRRRKPPLGTTFSFTLNQPATATLTFTTRVRGRKAAHKCVGETRRNAKHKACKRTVTAGTLSFSGHAGANTIAFQGRISSSKKLKPGRYTLTIEASGSAGRSAPARLTFTIVK